jgi:tetratricopeptide (TPR) repeat protein
MKDGENERAKKCLARAAQIDVSNTTTLRYLRELEAPAGAYDADANPEAAQGSAPSIMPISTYKEDKPNIMAFVNLVIGVVIGLALFAVLILPSITKKQKANENADYVNLNSSLALQQEKDATINNLKADNEDLKNQVSQLQNQIDSFVVPEDKTNAYDALFDAAEKYLAEQAKPESERDLTGIADSLALIDEKSYGSEAAVAMLTELRTEIYPVVSNSYYKSGRDLYDRTKYQEAQTAFEKAMNFDQTNVDAIYYLAKSYQKLNNKDKAILYYNIVITDFPNSDRRDNAEGYVAQLQQ